MVYPIIYRVLAPSLGCIKPCKWWDKLPQLVSRISEPSNRMRDGFSNLTCSAQWMANLTTLRGITYWVQGSLCIFYLYVKSTKLLHNYMWNKNEPIFRRKNKVQTFFSGSATAEWDTNLMFGTWQDEIQIRHKYRQCHNHTKEISPNWADLFLAD